MKGGKREGEKRGRQKQRQGDREAQTDRKTDRAIETRQNCVISVGYRGTNLAKHVIASPYDVPYGRADTSGSIHRLYV